MLGVLNTLREVTSSKPEGAATTGALYTVHNPGAPLSQMPTHCRRLGDQ